MKIGLRAPSIKRSIKARTTGKIKRTVQKNINPLYGKKGVGLVKDPSRSVKNSIYHKTTFSLKDLFSFNKDKDYYGDNYSHHTMYSSVNDDAYQVESSEFVVLPFFDIPVVARHFECLEKVVENYNNVTKNKAYFGKYAETVIANGLEDIAIAPEFIKCCKENDELIPTYPSFKILALLYEHREEYEEALIVCKQAVNLGFVDDGTKGTMTKRIEKLKKLLKEKTM